MKKQIPAFFSGALAATLALSLGITALAASGQVSFNGANIAVFGQQKIAADENISTDRGTQAPGSLTYTDEKGGGTVYLPMRLMAELLDANIVWDAATQTVNFGARANPSSIGDIEITVDDGAAPDFSSILDAPVFDMRAGPFTEIKPRTDVNRNSVLVQLDHADISSVTGFLNQRYYIDPLFDYVEITVTNHGVPVGFRVSRPIILSSFDAERFSSVKLDQGQTMTRAFSVGETDVDLLQRWLEFDVDALGLSASEPLKTDITVTVELFYQDGRQGAPSRFLDN